MIAWGVDVDTRAAHFAGVVVARPSSKPLGAMTVPVRWSAPKTRGRVDPVRRLVACRAALLQGLPDVERRLGVPDVVAVELPTGRHPSPTLMMHVGVVLEAVAVHAPVLPWLVGVTEWKKEIGLGGNASKDDVMRWALALGATPGSQDEADATGVAVAAAGWWQRQAAR